MRVTEVAWAALDAHAPVADVMERAIARRALGVMRRPGRHGTGKVVAAHLQLPPSLEFAQHMAGLEIVWQEPVEAVAGNVERLEVERR